VLQAGAVLLLLALVGLFAKSLVDSHTSIATQVADGKRPAAPNFTLGNVDGGGTTSLASFKGKVVVLNFWASWCVPCKAEAPVLERVQQRLQKDRAGTVFGVTYKDAPDASRAFVRQEKASWPNVRDDRLKLAPKFGTSQLPETFVIDRTGKIVAVSRGQIDQQFMDAALTRAGVPS
jgi:cytochrome c biogenesis protein CcmG/thiol:disulfide interchange protein DsbE